jgi:hypothetical protein
MLRHEHEGLVMQRLTIGLLLMSLLPGCSKLDTNRTVDSYSSFGEIVYRESCQRVAYTGQLDQKAAGVIQTVDVSGTLGHDVCVSGMAPPAMAPLKLSAARSSPSSISCCRRAS